jgi:hypothetical protein
MSCRCEAAAGDTGGIEASTEVAQSTNLKRAKGAT